MSVEIFSKITEAIENRESCVLCIVVDTKGSTPRKKASKMLVYADSRVEGSIGGGELEYFVVQKAVEQMYSKESSIYSFGLKADFEMACGGNVTVYMEPIKIPDRLIIFGAGHIGKSLSSLAAKFDFDIVVVDQRENIFSTWDKNLKAIFINKSYKEAIKDMVFDRNTYVCSATYAHSFDKEIAELLIDKQTAYLGIIASKNKASKISKYLLQNKFSAEKINRIDMPMGVPIACETPDEIAVSILAKIIDVRNS